MTELTKEEILLEIERKQGHLDRLKSQMRAGYNTSTLDIGIRFALEQEIEKLQALLPTKDQCQN